VFQLLKDPKFDFMKRGQLFVTISAIVVVLSVAILIFNGLNLGIEFTGGTEVQVKYSSAPDVGRIRSSLEGAGITAQVTTIGDASENEVYIRVAGEGESGEIEDLTGQVASLLRGPGAEGGKLDVNIAAAGSLATALQAAPGVTEAQAVELGRAIAAHRTEVAIYGSVGELGNVPGMPADVVSFLEGQAIAGPVAIRNQGYIGPAIGEELMEKAELAIVMSLIMMLIYIWIRFQLRWGFAAVIALAHDTTVTLGLFSVFNMEMSLPVVAAFLTLVGYSVNDTVVVFDRIRENLANRSAATLEATINLSINQTLSRTIITSGLTWVVVFGLYLFGGAALNAFAFVLSVGVLVGTYSSIFVAAPVLVLWSRFLGTQKAPATAAAEPGRAKKIRTT
jgi:preprotein translocase subunit SecF